MELLEMMKHRRSIRSYTGEPVSDENMELILKAGLLAPSGKNIKPWEFVVVKDKETLKKLSVCRPGGAAMLKDADAVIVVFGNTGASDVWTEDCSISMAYMHLMADALGVGSVWVQGRLRENPDGGMAEDVVRDLLKVPDNYALEAFLSLGMPAVFPEAREEEALSYDKIHRETF